MTRFVALLLVANTKGLFMSQETFSKTKQAAGTTPVSPPTRPGEFARATQSAAVTGADRDALAGALPGWDLLPATPFIRRVK